jgi:hypothetical protein
MTIAACHLADQVERHCSHVVYGGLAPVWPNPIRDDQIGTANAILIFMADE